MLRYLAVLAVMLACFTGDVSTVTDQEFQIMQSQLQELSILVRSQASKIVDLEEQMKSTQDSSEAVLDTIQNSTIEERVTTLELQMANVQEEMSEINEDVTGLDEDVSFLFGEQLIQDERLLNLEVANDEIEDAVEILEDTTQALDFRVTELEENGGGGGNSSISELEERVETLEGTATDHETRITSSEGDIEDLQGSSADHETRLTAAEENIQGLQMTDISLDARITALEENGGGGGGGFQNDTIAFYAALMDYTSISVSDVVEFDEVIVNQGNGYDSTTGVFSVPALGDGLYYFSTNLLVEIAEQAYFDIQVNDVEICTAMGDQNNNGDGDYAQGACSVVVNLVEDDEVKVVCRYTDDVTPLYVHPNFKFNGFNGFRI